MTPGNPPLHMLASSYEQEQKIAAVGATARVLCWKHFLYTAAESDMFLLCPVSMPFFSGRRHGFKPKGVQVGFIVANMS